MKFPIGIQSFEQLRNGRYVYVDKTELIYKLTQNYTTVFLGRPRRFGKSLLMSTLQAYFEGRRHLFDGLAIDELEQDWTVRPVLHFDFNNGNYSSVTGLINVLNNQLSRYEEMYGRNPYVDEPQFRLEWLIRRAYEVTGVRPVVLVDEYDKPVLQAIGNSDNDNEIRNILKPFYGTLKSQGGILRFVMLTGVSKFGKLSVFSDLNNIKDVSLLPDFAEICGITKDEITKIFGDQIVDFAKNMQVDIQTMIELLRRKYDGYRFTPAVSKVFNPYSLLNALSDKQLKDYWFESGTPTFLVDMLKYNNFDLSKIEGREIDEDMLYKVDNVSVIPLLYQSGYLTIKEYDREWRLCKLGYPNQEVETGFINFLIPFYSNVASDDTTGELNKLVREIRSGDVDSFMRRLQSMFYSIPYAHDNSMKIQEDQFRNLLYLIFKLIGVYMQVECPMCSGRSDAVVTTSNHVYIFEFKVNETPDEALRQILEKHYDKPYVAGKKTITLIGVNYSTNESAITGWQMQQP